MVNLTLVMLISVGFLLVAIGGYVMVAKARRKNCIHDQETFRDWDTFRICKKCKTKQVLTE